MTDLLFGHAGMIFGLGLLCGVALASAWYGLLAWVSELFRR